MFDFSWSEVALIVIVALIFIGPKDFPVAIRSVSRAIKALRRMASEFQTHVDDFVRETDLDNASSHLRDLHPMNLRHRIINSIDADRTMRDGLKLNPPPSLSSSVHASAERDAQNIERDVTPTATLSDTLPHDKFDLCMGDAPSSLPPATARRIARERRELAAPRYLPPARIVHGGRRVSLKVDEGVAEIRREDESGLLHQNEDAMASRASTHR